ncbi:MAG: hypothetical protein M3081_01720, partial [Gemmatimonadota bacterium]|nr:hypothetical protein [Gemmatimonadota bacterium]
MSSARSMLFIACAITIALAPAATLRAQNDATAASRPSGGRALATADAASWKSIRNSTLSNDGHWFGYQLMPNEGDGDVVVRATKGPKEYRFPIGEVPTGAAAFGAPGGPPPVAFSSDGRWVAFTIAPDTKEAKRLRRDRKPLQNRVALVNLETGAKTEFQKARRFAFSGDRGGWLAVLGYGPDEPAPTPAPGGA